MYRCTCVHVCIGPKTTSGVIPEELSTLYFKSFSLGSELINQARLGGQQAPGSTCSACPALTLQVCAIMPGYFSLSPGAQTDVICLHDKRCTNCLLSCSPSCLQRECASHYVLWTVLRSTILLPLPPCWYARPPPLICLPLSGQGLIFPPVTVIDDTQESNLKGKWLILAHSSGKGIALQ